MSKKMKLGLHTYTLHLWGLGQDRSGPDDKRPKVINLIQLMDLACEWGLDGLQVTGCDLETKDEGRLAEVREAAENRELYLEYNFSMDDAFDSRLTDPVEDGIRIAHKIGADLATVGLDIRRPRPLYGSCFHPEVMRGLCDAHDEIKAALPLLEETGIRLAVENQAGTYIDEILWLIQKVDHPLVGACLDTVNSAGVLENPADALEKLAKHALCVHFCDHKVAHDQFGVSYHGMALGDGDIDCEKISQTIQEQSPTDRITIEVKWDMGSDTLETAREKEMEACIESIEYAREVLKLGEKTA